MPQGDLRVEISDLTGEPVAGRVEVEMRRVQGESGTGGESMGLSVNMGSDTELIITGITCRGGPGTMYKFTLSAPHFRDYSFFQLIKESVVNTASDDVEFWVKPGDVTEIRAPEFDDLPERLRGILAGAQMRAEKPEDQDLLGVTGAPLYEKLGPLRKACLLNIAKKASHRSSEDCFDSVGALMVCRQDRFFANVDASLPERLRASPLYKSAPDKLHEPLAGYELSEGSFKTRDARGNLQVTFMRHAQTGELAADIDMDESSGIEHGFEVIRNAAFRKRTNPYLIREFMLVADLQEHTLDPGYRFVF